MQTQYQLLYRYINETTNTAVTNEYDYKETKEFYTPDHELYFTTKRLKELAVRYITIGEIKELGLDPRYYNADTNMYSPPGGQPPYRLDMVRLRDLRFWFENKDNVDAGNGDIYTNALGQAYVENIIRQAEQTRENVVLTEMANANKSNNFYIYTGTTKEYHSTFIPASLGYKVKNPKAVPTEQYPTGPDDYSKHFVMIGGEKPGIDGAFLVCKSEFVDAYITSYTDTVENTNQRALTAERLANTMMFDWYNPNDNYYVPLYLETPGVLTGIEAQKVDKSLSNYESRIITLSGEQYLITECVEYWNNITVTYNRTTYVGDHPYRKYYYHYDFKYDGTVHESTINSKRTLYGTIFFECGDIVPREITFSTEDGATLASTQDILPDMYYDTDGDMVLYAFGQYTMGLKDTLITLDEPYEQAATAVSEENQRIKCETSTLSQHKFLRWYKGWKIKDLIDANMDKYYSSIDIQKENLTRYYIPAHYEPSGKAPYLIKDNYKKITMSPWILHSVHDSLTSGLDKARELVSMIGIENVKLIKTVPFDQFVKIK